MESKFKVGDKVKLDLSAKYSGDCCITETMRTFDQKEYVITYSIGETYDGKPRYQLSGCDHFYFVEEWLTLVSKGTSGDIVISVSEFKRIHDIACDNWKKRIAEMVQPFAETVSISQEFARKMISASTGSQLPVVLEVLRGAGYQQESEKYFDFGKEHTISTESIKSPLFIRMNLASKGDMKLKELGFSAGYARILVDEDGNETLLTSDHYLKFKKK